jgi:hypothetical protein
MTFRKPAAAFARRYLDQFGCENFDGQGIKASEILSAEWVRGVVSGQETDIVRAQVRLASGAVEELECWGDDPPNVGMGHIFTSVVRRMRAHPESHWARKEGAA